MKITGLPSASPPTAPNVPTVTVATRQHLDRVAIRVSDHGAGIPPGVCDKTFEPLYTTKPTGDGTGLGLSLSYDIVVQGHGGSLDVEGTEGQGTTFIVALPLHEAKSAEGSWLRPNTIQITSVIARSVATKQSRKSS